MPNACAVRLKDRWLIYPQLRTVSGFFVAGEPFQSLPNDATSADLAQAVRIAFTHATKTVPNPADWKALSAPRLAAAGVKTETAFQRKSQLIGITSEMASIRITPTRNGGASGNDKGFHKLEDISKVVSADCTDYELGEVLNDALSACL